VFDNLHNVGRPMGERDHGRRSWPTTHHCIVNPNAAGFGLPEFDGARPLLEFTNDGPVTGSVPSLTGWT
jgi:hypothetical protein